RAGRATHDVVRCRRRSVELRPMGTPPSATPGKLVGRVPRAPRKSGEPVRVEYPPYDVLVALVDGVPRAIEDACNHAGASLSEGPIENGCIMCPQHGYVFSLVTGKLIAPRGLCDDQRT